MLLLMTTTMKKSKTGQASGLEIAGLSAEMLLLLNYFLPCLLIYFLFIIIIIFALLLVVHGGNFDGVLFCRGRESFWFCRTQVEEREEREDLHRTRVHLRMKIHVSSK